MEGARVAVVRSVQGKLADVGSRALGAGGASMVKLARCAGGYWRRATSSRLVTPGLQAGCGLFKAQLVVAGRSQVAARRHLKCPCAMAYFCELK